MDRYINKEGAGYRERLREIETEGQRDMYTDRYIDRWIDGLIDRARV